LMERILVTVQPVTATFLHSEPEAEARWRAAPFRGLTRWWFRALVGAAFDEREVREREVALFGSAESPSPVVMRVRSGAGNSQQFLINPSGRSGDKRYSAKRSALAPAGAGVDLELRPAGRGVHPDILRQAYAALWAAAHFGGFGQRSRRGAGSLRMVRVQGVERPVPVIEGDADRYAAALAEGLRAAREALGAMRLRSLGPEASFPTLHPKCASVWVVGGPGMTSETDVRRHVMDVRRGLPSHSGPGREAEFGFAGMDRLASPVWIRVADFDPDRALFVVTLLRHRPERVAQPRWENVEAFVRALGAEGVPVDLGGAAR
jgi:CRISPR type III-B/RAMP module RAMP protein Cmr1